MNKRILVIPDLHIPFQHQDAFKFLKAVKAKYKPDRVLCTGDEQDLHSMSMHDHDPDLHSPSDELKQCDKYFQALFKLFPKMDLVDSNHGSLVLRRAKKNGLPSRVIRTPKEYLKAPKGWTWHDNLIVTMSNGKKVALWHGLKSDCLANSKNKGINFMQGHHHSRFEIRYWANHEDLFWSCTAGCLIDKDKLAFAYGKLIIDKPILGCLMLLNGQPMLIPMILNKFGRWIGKL
jgi:hypothetical protein